MRYLFKAGERTQRTVGIKTKPLIGKCVLCGKSTRRVHNPYRPCCGRCEKTAPTVFTTPGLFVNDVAGKVARAIVAWGEEITKNDKIQNPGPAPGGDSSN